MPDNVKYFSHCWYVWLLTAFNCIILLLLRQNPTQVLNQKMYKQYKADTDSFLLLITYAQRLETSILLPSEKTLGWDFVISFSLCHCLLQREWLWVILEALGNGADNVSCYPHHESIGRMSFTLMREQLNSEMEVTGNALRSYTEKISNSLPIFINEISRPCLPLHHARMAFIQL